MNNAAKILVVGDLAIDRYYKGHVTGMSAEGPYPVVMNPKPTHNLGCAANVAKNIKIMFPGVHVDMMAVIGHDMMGKKAKQLLRASSVGSDLIFKRGVTTITKNRLVADGVTIARWDQEQDNNVTDKLEVINRMLAVAKRYNVIVFSDYNKGMVFKQLVTTARLNKAQNAIILVDPKKNFSNYVGVDLIKPNMKELRDFGEFDNSDIRTFCENLLEKNQISRMLLTKSEDGMSLYSSSENIESRKRLFYCTDYKCKAKSVTDVTGAGDIVIATIAGLLSIGFGYQDSAKVANTAAGISVGKFGTSTVTMDEILEEIKCQDLTKRLLMKLGK